MEFQLLQWMMVGGDGQRIFVEEISLIRSLKFGEKKCEVILCFYVRHADDIEWMKFDW